MPSLPETTSDKKQWKLTVAYDGTEFHGWQVQPCHTTIQGTLSDAIAAVTGERVLPQGSGRTDAGVHALGQVASFALAAPIPAENLQRALNRVLPGAIRIVAAEQVVADFHARHSAVGKIYQYRIFQGAVCSPFLVRYVTPWRWQLDLAAMQQAAQLVLGEHDFRAFAASDPDRTARSMQEGGDEENTVRTIEQSEWTRVPFSTSEMQLAANRLDGIFPSAFQEQDGENRPDLLLYTVRGNGFLHHMVRNLVGTFLEVGRGRLAPSSVIQILDGRDRALAGPTAPARGLCLVQVLYAADDANVTKKRSERFL